MDKELIDIDSILSYLEKAAANHESLPPERFLDAARNLNALLGNETDELIMLRHKIACLLRDYLEEGKSVAAAKVIVESRDEYMQMKKQEAKIARVEEFIRIAKLTAKLKQSEFNHYA